MSRTPVTPAKAKQLLQQAGVPIPYPIHYTYSRRHAHHGQASLRAGRRLDQGGLQGDARGSVRHLLRRHPEPGQRPKYDVVWAGWGADWPNASTVIPPLFDSRVNLSGASNGSGLRLVRQPGHRTLPSTRPTTSRTLEAQRDVGGPGRVAGQGGCLHPAGHHQFPRLHGSKVANYTEDPATNGYPDLGQIGDQLS